MSQVTSSQGVKRMAPDAKMAGDVSIGLNDDKTPANAKKLRKERLALAYDTETLINRRDDMDHQISRAAQDKSQNGGEPQVELVLAASNLQDAERHHVQRLNNRITEAEKLWLAEPIETLHYNMVSLFELRARFKDHLGPRMVSTLEDDNTSSSDPCSDDEGSINNDTALSKANSSVKRRAQDESNRKHVGDDEPPSKKFKQGENKTVESPVPIPVPIQKAQGNRLSESRRGQAIHNTDFHEYVSGGKTKHSKDTAHRLSDVEEDFSRRQLQSSEKHAESTAEKKARKKREKTMKKKERKRTKNATSQHKRGESRRRSTEKKADDNSEDKPAPEVRRVTAVPIPAHYPRPDTPLKSISSVPLPGHYKQTSAQATPMSVRHGTKIQAPVDPGAVKHHEGGPRRPYLPIFHSADYATDGRDAIPKTATPDPKASTKTWRLESSEHRRSHGGSDITMRIGRIGSTDDTMRHPDPADESPVEVVRKNKDGRPKGSKTQTATTKSPIAPSNAKPATTIATSPMATLPSTGSQPSELVRVLAPSNLVPIAFYSPASIHEQQAREARFKAQLEKDAEVFVRERIEWRRAMNLD
ncbi:predicted protein [Verticillium alfalfae VaMs.102]|uniref:Predicted protein n=1 Tax=Verticillium alfalfae (strain VaMs.102 / ATCC MYA-4576 / FGSC 10136) TaxID=526221 RepID=C9SME2_VERA1|nr:predicted protein [Verticillium alfalfae VaMs.102]EEY19957.1 predicted protein [Verticillium alfalfae VaMs.102]